MLLLALALGCSVFVVLQSTGGREGLEGDSLFLAKAKWLGKVHDPRKAAKASMPAVVQKQDVQAQEDGRTNRHGAGQSGVAVATPPGDLRTDNVDEGHAGRGVGQVSLGTGLDMHEGQETGMGDNLQPGGEGEGGVKVADGAKAVAADGDQDADAAAEEGLDYEDEGEDEELGELKGQKPPSKSGEVRRARGSCSLFFTRLSLVVGSPADDEEAKRLNRGSFAALPAALQRHQQGGNPKQHGQAYLKCPRNVTAATPNLEGLSLSLPEGNSRCQTPPPPPLPPLKTYHLDTRQRNSRIPSFRAVRCPAAAQRRHLCHPAELPAPPAEGNEDPGEKCRPPPSELLRGHQRDKAVGLMRG